MSLVINYQMASTIEAYVHRIGEFLLVFFYFLHVGRWFILVHLGETYFCNSILTLILLIYWFCFFTFLGTARMGVVDVWLFLGTGVGPGL